MRILLLGVLAIMSPFVNCAADSAEQRSVSQVCMIERPADLGQAKRIGVDKVAALPCRVELLFEVEERLVIGRIAEAYSQEVDTIAQERLFFGIYVAEGSQTQTCHLEPAAFHIFE